VLGLAAGAATGVLAACGAQQQRPETGDASTTPVRLQFAFYADPEQIQLFKDVGALLPKEEPRIEVESLPFTPDEYMAKIGTQLAAGTAPDVMIMTDKEHPAQAVQGAFLDLGPLLKRTRIIPKKEFFVSEWNKYVVDGVLRGLPVISTQGVIWYRTDVFRDRSVATPPADWNDLKWTWQAFLETMQKVSTGEGADRVYGYDGQQNWWYAQPWVWSNGGNILNADNTAAVLDRPEAQEGWQWMVDLVSRYKVMPSAADLKAGGSRRPMFYAGRLASLMDVTAFATVLDAYPDVPWNVAALPHGKAAATTRSPGVGVAVWAQTQHQTEAGRLMETVTGPPGARLFAQSHRGVPGFRKVAYSDDWATPGSRIHWRIFPEALDGHSRAEQVTVKFPDMNRLIQQEWDKTLGGTQSVSQMVTVLKPQIDALLKDGRRIRIGE